MAGIAYELIWTRVLAASLGTEMAAALGVVSGFFAGLALGALVLDGPIRRARSARRAYASLEAAIAAWAVVSVALLPYAGQELLASLGATPSQAALWAAAFAMPALLLLPATACMGGTLIALERLTSALAGSGRVASGVYGANTAGAVAGSLIAVLGLMPALGLSGALLALGAINAACALGALALPAQADERPPASAVPSRLGQPRLLLTLAATGLLGIVVEVLVVRMAAQVLQNTIYSFAALLAAYLLGTAAGGLIWQRTRLPPTAGAVAALLTGTACATLLTAALVRGLGPMALAREPAGLGAELAIATLLFLPPTVASGALFGALLQVARNRFGSLGRAVGVNAAGAALAPPVAGLLLLPAAGAWTALIGAALLYLLLLPAPPRRAVRWAALPAGLALLLWLLPAAPLIRLPAGFTLIALREGPTATAAVVADSAGTRFLEVNGHFRMGGTSSLRSDWRQAQIPLLLHPHPHRALFLGVGTGATLAGAAELSGVTATGVELLPEVVALLPSFADPGAPSASVLTADARRFAAADRSRYDVIVADLFHPALDGTGSLYTEEHFRAVRERLVPDGVFCQWLPLYQLDMPSLLSIVRAFLRAYPDGSAWLAHYSLQTPMLALIGNLGPIEPAALEQRLRDPAARTALERTGLERPMDVLGLYLAGPAELAALVGPGPVNTDDRPFVTFDAQRNVRALGAAPAERLMALLGQSSLPAPPKGAEALAARLAAYWRARDRFLEAGAALPPGLDGFALMNAAIPGLLASVQLSPEFEPAYAPLLGMARSLVESGPRERAVGIKLLQAIDAAAPSRPEARDALARAPR